MAAASRVELRDEVGHLSVAAAQEGAEAGVL